MSYSDDISQSPLSSPPPLTLAQPDHFYSSDEHDTASSSPASAARPWLTPDDDPLASKGIPVFRPSMDEFSDFEQYMTRIEPWGMRSGIVKIIPPREWTDALPSVKDQLRDVRIKSPIEQIMLGRSGLFRQQNIEKRKAMSVREWAELCAKDDFRAPAVDEVALKAGAEHIFPTRRTRRAAKKRDTSEEHVDMQLTVVKDEGDEDSTTLGTELKATEDDADADADAELLHETTLKKRRPHTRTDKEAALAKRSELDNAFLDSFDPAIDWLPRGTQSSDYTPSFCNILERRFWRNCGLGRPAWYGADTAGSLFTDKTKEWNVSCLPSTLSRLLPSNGKGLPGVNTPYLYFGMWRATFAWHVEDMDLFSINYIHFGAPKFWYAMPQARAVQLENTLRSCFPSDVASCKQFLRHKSFLASPNLLSQSCCKPNTCVQRAGEFIVTYPRGYHAGFNLGFNCAESVNFALDSWLELGRKAEACGCVGDSVRINVDDLLAQREEEREREREKYENALKLAKAKTNSSQKRKTDGTLEHRKMKKIKIHIDSKSPSSSSSSASTSSSTGAAPKQKIILKVTKAAERFPCCLCTSYDQEDLLPIHDQPGPRSGCQNYMVRDAEGNEVWRAHEKCAMLVPETWVDEVAGPDGLVEKKVFGVDAIVKDRWALKCNLCQKPRAKAHGAPVQCTKGKCPKAFHLSCARSSDPESRLYFAELREVEKNVIINDFSVTSPSTTNVEGEEEERETDTPPINDDDSQDYQEPAEAVGPPSTTFFKTIKKLEYELLCNQHNPAVAATKRANKLDRVRKELLALPAMSRVKLRVSAGVFEVSLLSVDEERGTVEVIWDEGYPRVFKWSSLVWGKLEGQSVGQKPTVAVPKPRTLSIHHSSQSPAASLTPTPETGHSTSPPTYNPFSPVQVFHPPSATITSQPPASGTYSYYSYVPNSSPFLHPGLPGAPYPYLPQSNMQFSMPMQPYGYYANQALGPTSWPGAPLPPPPTNTVTPHLIPPMHSLFSGTTKPSPTTSMGMVPFSDQFQQAIAASVAALPFRAGFPLNKNTAVASSTSAALPSPPPSVSAASEQGSSTPSPTSGTGTGRNDTEEKDTDKRKQQPSAGDGGGKKNDGKKKATNNEGASSGSADVLAAIKQMQALSSVDKDVLVKMMEAQPSLREAMNTILIHSAAASVVSS